MLRRTFLASVASALAAPAVLFGRQATFREWLKSLPKGTMLIEHRQLGKQSKHEVRFPDGTVRPHPDRGWRMPNGKIIWMYNNA